MSKDFTRLITFVIKHRALQTVNTSLPYIEVAADGFELSSLTENGYLVVNSEDAFLDAGLYPTDSLSKICNVLEKDDEILGQVESTLQVKRKRKTVKLTLPLLTDEVRVDPSFYHDPSVEYTDIIAVDTVYLKTLLTRAEAFVDPNNINSDFIIHRGLLLAHNTISVFLGSLEAQDCDDLKVSDLEYTLTLNGKAPSALLSLIAYTTDETLTISYKPGVCKVTTSDVTLYLATSKKPEALGANLLNMVKSEFQNASGTNLRVVDIKDACFAISKLSANDNPLFLLQDQLVSAQDKCYTEDEKLNTTSQGFLCQNRLLLDALKFAKDEDEVREFVKDGGVSSIFIASHQEGSVSLIKPTIQR